MTRTWRNYKIAECEILHLTRSLLWHKNPIDCQRKGVHIFNFDKNRKWIEDLALVSQVGLTLIGSVLFCFVLGYYLDKWLGLRYLFKIMFILLGIAGGGYTAFRQIKERLEDK
jgi:hypothetical protein